VSVETPNDFLRELQRDYLAEAPGRLAEVRKDLAAMQAGEPDAWLSLQTRFHRLAGSGGSYGFPDISTIGRALEQALRLDPTAEDVARIEDGIHQLALAFDGAWASLGSGDSLPTASFAWRVLVSGPVGDTRDRAEALLTGAGFTVDAHAAAISFPASSRPDLLVLLADHRADGEEAATESLLESWRALAHSPMPCVLLVDRPGRTSRLRTGTLGVDQVVTPEEMDSQLPAWALTAARIHSTPMGAFLLAPEADRVEQALHAIQKLGMYVEIFTGSDTLALETERTLPDVILADWGPNGAWQDEVVRATRVLRTGDRWPSLPILTIEFTGSESERVALLTAGMDGVLPPTDRLNLARIVRSRALRSLHTRILAHTDELTGLLNRHAILAELEGAVAHATRFREPLAIAAIDIDHLRRVNERFGPVIGNAVLTHITRVIGACVRASDTMGRVGGEEFVVIWNHCVRAGAAVAAEQVRAAVENSPFVHPGGQVIPLHVTIGTAQWPEEGATASALYQAAMRALSAGKTAGRNRVVAAGAGEIGQ